MLSVSISSFFMGIHFISDTKQMPELKIESVFFRRASTVAICNHKLYTFSDPCMDYKYDDLQKAGYRWVHDLQNASSKWHQIEEPPLFYLETPSKYGSKKNYQIDNLSYSINKVVDPKSLYNYTDVQNLFIDEIQTNTIIDEHSYSSTPL